MAARAVWLCCPLYSALLCGCPSCTFASLHFQHLLHGQADWTAPCSSAILPWNEQLEMTWQDGIAEDISSPKAAKVYPHFSLDLNPLIHSESWALTVLMEEIPPISLEFHHTSWARVQTDHTPESPEEPHQFYTIEKWKLQVLFKLIFSVSLVFGLLGFFPFTAAALFIGHRLLKFSIYHLFANQWKGSWNE